MSNSVVTVAGFRSLFVYAAAVTPPVVPDAGGVGRYGSAIVEWVAGLCRRFWPLSLITRSRSAAGLKSTQKVEPSSGTESCETFLTTTSVGTGGLGGGVEMV